MSPICCIREFIEWADVAKMSTKMHCATIRFIEITCVFVLLLLLTTNC